MVDGMRAALVALAFVGAGPAAAEYLIQPGDRLEISVLEDPSLNRTPIVRPDGLITMPLAGNVQAAGRTTTAIQNQIRSRLSRDFVEPPTVTVDIVGFRDSGVFDPVEPATVYVIGAVSRPGPYEVALPIDVLRMLSIAGGPGTFAARQRIQIRRSDPAETGGQTVFLFDYDLVERGGVPMAEIQLRDGDVIVVPERRLFE